MEEACRYCHVLLLSLTDVWLAKAQHLQEWLVEAQLEVGDSIEYNGDDMTWDQDVYEDMSRKTPGTGYMGDDANDDNDDNDNPEALSHLFSKYFKPEIHVYVRWSF